ncbi:ubiquinone/menaquinone biosynthesis C-methyltransferase UbiE [Nitrospira sp.]|nr:ubiquinone/menaquinone biosynthesis C-methyltransferase UbiE [Nitrospira sp.]
MVQVQDPPLEPRTEPVAPQAVSRWSGQAREQAVQNMFTAIARWYDLNNTLLSFGLHHRWKHQVIECLMDRSASARGVRSSEVSAELRSVLDIGAGTADLALLIEPRLQPQGRVIAADLNHAMLVEGQRKVRARGLSARIACMEVNAEHLSFPDGRFDAVTTGFCMRNVGNLGVAFNEIHRVLKPGGRFVCLEFSRPPQAWLRSLYDWYSFTLLPRIGTLVAKDRTGVYEYLPASIRTFPDQETLCRRLMDAGFCDVSYRNLTGGIVAIHWASKGAESSVK